MNSGGKVLSLFSAKNAIAFGKNLANDLSGLYPVSLDGSAKVSADRVGRILEKLYIRAQSYQGENNLGYYRKTRLCHAFKWRLTEIGYSKQFIDLATEGLVVYLHKPPVSESPAFAQAQAKRARKAEQHKAAK